MGWDGERMERGQERTGLRQRRREEKHGGKRRGSRSGRSSKSREEGKKGKRGKRRKMGKSGKSGKSRKSGKRWEIRRQVHLILYLTLSQRVRVPIVPMIAHHGITWVKGIHIVRIRRHLILRIRYILMCPGTTQEGRLRLAGRDVVMEDMRIQGLRPYSLLTDQDTGSNRSILMDFLHDSVP